MYYRVQVGGGRWHALRPELRQSSHQRRCFAVGADSKSRFRCELANEKCQLGLAYHDQIISQYSQDGLGHTYLLRQATVAYVISVF